VEDRQLRAWGQVEQINPAIFMEKEEERRRGVCYKSNNIVGVQKVKEKAMMQYKVELESRDWTRFGCFHLGFLSKG
jgi:hypothetical protein